MYSKFTFKCIAHFNFNIYFPYLEICCRLSIPNEIGGGSQVLSLKSLSLY